MDDLPDKLGEKAIEEISKRLDAGLRDFLKAIGGEAAVQTGGMLGDQFRYWRFKNTLRILDQTAEILRKRGVEPARVLPSHLVPLLEAASLEEDDTLTQKWASLLANAADPARHIGLTPTYIDVLRQLSTAEVVFLDELSSSAIIGPLQTDDSAGPRISAEFAYSDMKSLMHEYVPDSAAFVVIAENLKRLNICSIHGRTRMLYETPVPLMSLTPFGVAFMKACSEDTTESE